MNTFIIGSASRRLALRSTLAALALTSVALAGGCGKGQQALIQPTSTPAPSPTVASAPAYWPTSGWRTSTPEEQGVDSTQLLRALQHIEDANINVRSITIIRDGYIVLEMFRQPFTPTAQYPVFSVTKSVTGALIGIATSEGYIKGVNESVLGFFLGMNIANRDANKEAITLEDLLTMQPGLNCADKDIGYVVEGSEDWVQYILDLPMAAPPRQKFTYCTAGPHILSAILTKATGMSTAAYAQSRLFGPLGIVSNNVAWAADPQGVSIGGYGLSMETRDMAKLGLLYLYDGKWEDREIVPQQWVAASTTVHSTERPGKSYGYLIWAYPDDPTPYFAAEGLGSQVIQVVKERNMVVVMTAAINDTQGQVVRDLLQDYIIPAAVSNASLPANPSAQAALQAKVAYLADPVKPIPPLSDTALRIAGKTYVMEANNSLNVREFSAAFAEGKPDVLIHAVSTDGANAQLTIGLDNVYRQTPGDPTWRRGWWEDDHTFILKELDTAGIQERETHFSFTGDKVRIHAEEITLGSYRYDLKGTLK